MRKDELMKQIYKIAEKHNVILKGNIKICGNVNCVVFAHYCRSTLFYRDFFHVTLDVFKAYKDSRNNLKQIKKILMLNGYKKIKTKGVFSIYGDLRPLAIEAGLGKWSINGLVTNQKYGTNFLITAIFFNNYERSK